MMLSNVPICLIFLWQGLTATGLTRDQIFVGDINTLYKSGKTTVDYQSVTVIFDATAAATPDIHAGK